MHSHSSCIVLCAGSGGVAIGRELAKFAGKRRASNLIFLEARTSGTVRSLTVDDELADEDLSLERAVGSFLSIANPNVTNPANYMFALRMVVLGKYGEISPAALGDLIEESALVADRRIGGRRTIECMFYLPPSPESLREPFKQSSEGSPVSSTGAATEYIEAFQSALGAADYCWWFTSMNSLGLSLPEAACEAFAALLYAAVSVTPESYASSFDIMAARPLHLCAGFAELSVSRADIVACLSARYLARLIRRRYLRAREVHMESMSKSVREVADACEKLIEDIALTPGKERIWKGWDKSVPDFSSDNISGFLARQRTALSSFFGSLPGIRKQGRSSARHGMQDFLRSFRAELEQIDRYYLGAASTCIDFVSRIAAFLIDMSDFDEEDPNPANIQTVRREFDTAFAEAVHFLCDVNTDEARQRFVKARSDLSRIERLIAISAPPAVSAERWAEIHWGIEGSAGLTKAACDAEKRLRERWNDWLQSLARKEAKMQGAIDAVPSERKRRDDAIEAAERELHRSAEEYRRLAQKLKYLSGWSRFFASAPWTPCGRQLRRLHSRVGELRSHVLPTDGLRVAEAYSNRAQLEVQRIFYRIRDGTLQLILNCVRSAYKDQSATITVLEEIATRNSRAGMAVDPCPFSRALISDDDLEIILDDFERNQELSPHQEYPGFLDVVSRPPEDIEAALIDHSRPLLQEMQSRPISYYIQTAGCDLNVALTWMRHASQPWFPYDPPDVDESVVVLADDGSWRNGPLRGAFPGAKWVANRTSDSAAVFRVRPIGTFDQVLSHLSRRGFLPIGKRVVISAAH